MSQRFKLQINQLPVVEIDAGSSLTLLEHLEQSGIEARYHCRSGFCGACRSVLHAGNVEYINEPLAYIRPGEILPCVCRVKSDLSLEH
ncbi:class I ribonucleotide reductase maintenance protein YfaE [Aliidiomarina celeris]|uniref:class I ribonucleotide reductase maintenance protein YfaE n=1 Tax=Aliidiomarina celeris TaxID=2249428 RepID=UPI000DE8349C|nr:class I ribonucleotide reductase maintenance protein YfaE [Aliidiomarina celeris]